jgi:hypothetical protein
MAKNVSSTAFRKVDVDQYEEEKYEDDVDTDTGATGPSEAEVQALLSKYPFHLLKLMSLCSAWNGFKVYWSPTGYRWLH